MEAENKRVFQLFLKCPRNVLGKNGRICKYNSEPRHAKKFKQLFNFALYLNHEFKQNLSTGQYFIFLLKEAVSPTSEENLCK